MKHPYTIPVPMLYKKNNGMYVMDITGKPFECEYEWIEKTCLSLPVGKVAGNHSHKHAEAFLAMTEGLEFHWQDEEKNIHIVKLFNASEKFFLILPPFVPHALVNRAGHTGIVIKFANEPPGIMKKETII